MSNTPDDWGQYWRSCDACGQQYHASDGECDCAERLREDLEQAILSAIRKEALWLIGFVDVGPGALITISQPLARACGYQSDQIAVGEPETRHRRTLARILSRIAASAFAGSDVDMEVRVTDHDGEVWTDQVFR